MADRSWFYASDGQQQGPYPEAQLRDLIARGTVRADTLVWTEGMAGWQKAGEIPGLMSGGSRPPAMPQSGRAADGRAPAVMAADRCRSIFRCGSFLGRSAAVRDRHALVIIPAPWVGDRFLSLDGRPVRQVPGRPNLAFTGQRRRSSGTCSSLIGAADLCRRSTIDYLQLIC